MAISYIGVSNLIATNGGAPGAITPAAASQVGDLLIFYHYSRAVDGTETATVPSGFTEFFNSTVNSGGLLVIGYRFEQAGDTTFTSTITNHTSGNSGETVLQWIETYRGADTTSPIKAVASASAWTSSLNIGSISPPASPAVSIGEMVVVVGGRFENITAQTTLTGDSLTWTARTRNDTTLGSDAGAVTQNGLNQTAGSVNVTAKTITTTGTAQLGTGTMFIIRDNTTQTISEPAKSFPVVETARCIGSTQGTNSSTFAVNVGTTGSSTGGLVGDLDIIFITADAAAEVITSNIPSGWNELSYNYRQGVAAAGAQPYGHGIYWRIRQSGDPSTVTFNFTDNGVAIAEQYTAVKVAITGYDTNSPISGYITGPNDSIDPANLTTPFSDKYLWLTSLHLNGTATTSAPSGYTQIANQQGGNSGATTSVAWIALEAQSENPGTWTSSSATDCNPVVIAINPILNDRSTASKFATVSISESGSATDNINLGPILVSVSESATGSDTTNCTNSSTNSVTETATATDSSDGTTATGLTGNLTESTSSSDSSNVVLSSTGSLSEFVTASDTSDKTIQASVSISESTAASDSENGSIVFPVSISESTSATDLTDETLQVSRSISEATSAADISDETIQVSKSISESTTAADASDKTIQTSASVSEVAAATDSESGVIVFPVSTSESGVATDTSNSTKTIGGLVSETTTSTDTNNTTASFASSITEAATGLDSTNGVRLYQVSVTETSTASDSTNRSLIVSTSLSEVTSAADSLNSTRSSPVSVSEPASAVDTSNFLGSAIPASITETASSSDSVSCTLSANKSISESSSAADSIGRTRESAVVITESVSSSDTTNAVRFFYSIVDESGNAVDLTSSIAQFSSSILETSSPVDMSDGGYKGLFKINSFTVHVVGLNDGISLDHRVAGSLIELGNHAVA